jgi:RNA polymerase sigma-70 factor (ECF subfamily)
MLADESIIELYWSRDEKAISETDKKYGKYLYSIAYNIVHDKLDSEECVNDTYLGTWNAIPPARPNAFRVFLAKITRNISINKFIKHTADKRIPSELIVSLDELGDCLPATPAVEEEIEAAELGKLLSAYLEELSSEKQLIFICRYYYADKISDIANITELNERTVYRMLESIRNGLREKLEKEGYKI